LSSPVNATISDGQGSGLILDDSDPRPAISIGDATVTEGDDGSGSLDFIVSMSGPSGQPISVAFATADGTAIACEDCLADSGRVSFQPGEVAKHVIVAVNGDTTIEPDETLTVTLSGQTFATIDDGSATGTITNDDAPPTLAIVGHATTEGSEQA